MEKVNRSMIFILILPIRLYQYLISPALTPRCRFHPSCSHYAVEAITKRGILIGCYLAIIRIFKCHPFHQGGVDLVPEKKK
jgi:uncharacterized protein